MPGPPIGLIASRGHRRPGKGCTLSNSDELYAASRAYSEMTVVLSRVFGLIRAAHREEVSNPLLPCYFPENEDLLKRLLESEACRHDIDQGAAIYRIPGKRFLWPNGDWEHLISEARELGPKWQRARLRGLAAIQTLGCVMDGTATGVESWTYKANRDLVQISRRIPAEVDESTRGKTPPLKSGDQLITHSPLKRPLMTDEAEEIVTRIADRCTDIEAMLWTLKANKQGTGGEPPKADTPTSSDDLPPAQKRAWGSYMWAVSELGETASLQECFALIVKRMPDQYLPTQFDTWDRNRRYAAKRLNVPRRKGSGGGTPTRSVVELKKRN